MSIPALLRKKFTARFEELILEGDEIQKNIATIPAYEPRRWGEGNLPRVPEKKIIDWPRLVKWRTNCVSLLDQVVPSGNPHRSSIEAFSIRVKSASEMDWAISTLKGIKDDFEKGFLGDISKVIEAEIAADYMGQAESLLRDGQTGKFDHVPAAVLAGAVLEKALRVICSNQTSPIPTINAKGEPKTLNPLIDDLKKAGVFTETKAKQLRSWAAIRNHAAHGEFDQFKRSDVEELIAGVNNFLADYLG